MAVRKDSEETATIVWAVRQPAPAGERLAPSPDACKPVESGTLSTSSLELMSGLGVKEAPLDTLPPELVDGFLGHCLADTGTACADGAADRDTPAADKLTLTLRALDDRAVQGPTAVPASPELIRSDPDFEWPTTDRNTVTDGEQDQGLPRVPVDLTRAVQKAAHRAAVRRASMASQRHGATPGPCDVMVLDENAVSRGQLSTLLEHFGFHVHTAHSIDQASEMLSERSFAAVFLDIALQAHGGAEAELCRRVKHAPMRAAARTPALFVTADRAEHAGRVRAALAGADRFLPKPPGRGDVVRALEDCDVFLPRDPRRT